MPRYTTLSRPGGFAEATPSPLDRLQQLQNLDTQDAQTSALSSDANLRAIRDLYGIQHEQQMQPEQLRALRASSAAREYETQAAPQDASYKHGLEQAQIGRLNSESTQSKKIDPALLVQMGILKGSDLLDPRGYEAAYNERLQRETAGKAAEREGIEHPPQLPIPSNLQHEVDPSFINDSKIQQSLSQLQQKNSGTTEEPSIALEQARRAAGMAAHPTSQVIHDLMHPDWDTYGPIGDIHDLYQRLTGPKQVTPQPQGSAATPPQIPSYGPSPYTSSYPEPLEMRLLRGAKGVYSDLFN